LAGFDNPETGLYPAVSNSAPVIRQVIKEEDGFHPQDVRPLRDAVARSLDLSEPWRLIESGKGP